MDETKIKNELGETGFSKLVAAFYRQAKEDEVLRPMYPHDDWDGAEQRLRDFLIFRFGISNKYVKKRGHPRLRMRHAPFKIGNIERDRWLQLMANAMLEVEMSSAVFEDLQAFFRQVADFMRNHQT